MPPGSSSHADHFSDIFSFYNHLAYQGSSSAKELEGIHIEISDNGWMISLIEIDQVKLVRPMFPERMDKGKEISGDNRSR